METKKQPETSMMEWILAIIGGVIVAGMLVFNISKAVNDNGSPPDIQLEVQSHVKTGQGFLVRIKAVNKGNSSAAGVSLEGALHDNGKEVEMSQVTFDYVPAHSTKEGGLYFVHDPQKLALKLRVLGYQDP